MSEMATLDDHRRTARWLALLLLAVGLHIFEASMPNLGPWLKPGLANIVTLLALPLLGVRAACTLALARVVIGALFSGTLLTPTFIISLAGALAATLIMAVAWQALPMFSLVGISLFGAVAHMLAQFVVVEALFIQQHALYYLLPPLLLLSLLTGWINGVIAEYVTRRIGIR